MSVEGASALVQWFAVCWNRNVPHSVFSVAPLVGFRQLGDEVGSGEIFVEPGGDATGEMALKTAASLRIEALQREAVKEVHIEYEQFDKELEDVCIAQTSGKMFGDLVGE